MKKIMKRNRLIFLIILVGITCFLFSFLRGEDKSVNISPSSLHPEEIFRNWYDSIYTFSVYLDQSKYQYIAGPNCDSPGWSMIGQETAQMHYTGPKDTGGRNTNLANFFATHITGTFIPKGPGKLPPPEYDFDAVGTLEGDYDVKPNYSQVDLDSANTTITFTATEFSQWSVVQTWGGVWGTGLPSGVTVDFTPTEVGKYKITGEAGNQSDYGELDAYKLEWEFKPPYIGVGETKDDVKVRLNAPPGCTKVVTFDVDGVGGADIATKTLTLDYQWRTLSLTGTSSSAAQNDTYIKNDSNEKELPFTVVDVESVWVDNYILCNAPGELLFAYIWPLDLDSGTLKIELEFPKGGNAIVDDSIGGVLTDGVAVTYSLAQIPDNQIWFSVTGTEPGSMKFKFTLKDDADRYAEMVKYSEERDIYKLVFDDKAELYVGEEVTVETKLLGPAGGELSINYTSEDCIHIEPINKTVSQKSDQVEEHLLIGKVPSEIEPDDDFIRAICPDDREVEVNEYLVKAPFVDLSMTGVPDSTENDNGSGGFVMVNDNNNDTHNDKLIDKNNPGKSDPDLRTVQIKWTPNKDNWLKITPATPLKLKLTKITSTTMDMVRIWKKPDRTDLLIEGSGSCEFTSRADVPSTVYVEGLRHGASRLTLSYSNPLLGDINPLEDKLKITAVRNDIDFQGLRDENKAHTQPVEETIGAFMDIKDPGINNWLTVRRPRPRATKHLPANGYVTLTWPSQIELYKTDEILPENLLSSPLKINFSEFGDDNIIKYFVHPVTPSSKPREVEIKTLYSALDGTLCTDIIKMTLIDLDIDTDSDNDGNLDENEDEDKIENDVPGKIVQINSNDLDLDGTIDYLDWEIKSQDFDENIFPEVKIKIPETIDRSKCRISLAYASSDPARAEAGGTLPPNLKLRLWTKKSNESRNTDSLKVFKTDGSPPVFNPDGNFVPHTIGTPGSDNTYTPDELLGAGKTERTFYLEAVKKYKNQTGTGTISVIIWSKGDEQENYDPLDKIRVYPVPIDMDIYFPKANSGQKLEETKEEIPGMLLGLNNDDDNNDGQPDYLDDSINGLKDRRTDMSRLLIHKMGKNLLDGGQVIVKKKDNSGNGHVRIFDSNGSVFLNTESSLSINPAAAKSLFEKLRKGNGVFFVEGTKAGALTLILEYENEKDILVGTDEIKIIIIDPVDIDTDSDNNGTIENQNGIEDSIEYLDIKTNPGNLGKVIGVNDGDKDSDGVVDYFDYEIKNSTFSTNIFTAVRLRLPENLDLNNMLIKINYSASIPPSGSTTPKLPKRKSLRLWTQSSNSVRNKLPIKDGGHFIAPSGQDLKSYYTPSELGIGNSREGNFYLEAVRKGFSEQNTSVITVSIIPKDVSFEKYTSEDKIRIFVLKVDSVKVHSTDDSTYKTPPVAGATHTDHFVCAKDTGDIILDAKLMPNTTVAGNIITWEAVGSTIVSPAINTDKTTAKLGSGTSNRIPVRIKVGSTTFWEGLVWVVWSTKTGSVAAPVAVPLTSSSGLRVGTSVSAVIRPSFTITPASIISSSDRPDLHGPNVLPNLTGTNNSGGSLAGGVNRRWDISRRIAVRATTTPAGLALASVDNSDDFPSDPVEGNDDAGAGDENNDPYSSPGVGKVVGYDAPTRPGPNSGSLSNGNVGNLYRSNLWFQEFARLQLGPNGSAKWYVISEPLFWRVEFKFRKVQITESLWGVDANGDGDLLDNITEAMIGLDANGDGDLLDNVGYWDNDGSSSANDNVGAPSP